MANKLPTNRRLYNNLNPAIISHKFNAKYFLELEEYWAHISLPDAQFAFCSRVYLFLIKLPDMAYEEECDIALMAISSERGAMDSTIYQAAKSHGIDLSNEKIVIITSILISNGFIRSNVERHDTLWQDSEFYFMTDKGFTFLNTDTFVQRQKRWDLERKLIEQQSTLNSIELGLKPYTFIIAVLGLAVAMGAAIIALYAALKK